MMMTLEDLQRKEQEKIKSMRKLQRAISSLKAEAENEEYNLRWIQFYMKVAEKSPKLEAEVLD